MTKIIDYDAMEAVLIASWHRFVDPKRLMASVLAHARDANLHIVPPEGGGKEIVAQTRLSVTRFQPVQGGFIVWADFAAPRPGGMGVGTAELFASLDGELKFLGLA